MRSRSPTGISSIEITLSLKPHQRAKTLHAEGQHIFSVLTSAVAVSFAIPYVFIASFGTRALVWWACSEPQIANSLVVQYWFDMTNVIASKIQKQLIPKNILCSIHILSRQFTFICNSLPYTMQWPKGMKKRTAKPPILWRTPNQEELVYLSGQQQQRAPA